MRKIKKYVDIIEDELESAEEYAENYIEFKADGDQKLADRFYDMANDELNHAITIHELAVKDIDKISAVFSPPAEMREKWERSHQDYIAKTSRIKSMLGM